MMTLGPRLLAPLGRIAEREGRVGPSVLGVVLILFMLSAWAMDAVGIHAVFGGFILGVAMPRGLLTAEIKRQLEPFAVLVLLPMFFTFSGLNTQLTIVDNIGLAAVTLVILAGSVLAKGGACWAAARPTPPPWSGPWRASARTPPTLSWRGRPSCSCTSSPAPPSPRC